MHAVTGVKSQIQAQCSEAPRKVWLILVSGDWGLQEWISF